jgi:hypothetical protein
MKLVTKYQISAINSCLEKYLGTDRRTDRGKTVNHPPLVERGYKKKQGKNLKDLMVNSEKERLENFQSKILKPHPFYTSQDIFIHTKFIGGHRPPFSELSYRLVKTCFNRIFPISSLPFFFLPCFVIFALKYTRYLLIFLKNKLFLKSPLWKCLDPSLKLSLSPLVSDQQISK